MSRPAKHTPPADFAERWQAMSQQQLSAHYNRGNSTISEWCKVLGLARPTSVKLTPASAKRREMPGDFRTHVHLPIATLCERYGASKGIVARWTAEVGHVRTYYHSRAIAKPKMLLSALSKLNVERHARDMSRAGQAADYLRKFGPVFRCDGNGRQSASGGFWRRGNAILSDADLIDRAEWKGWDPDAWKRVA